MPWVRLDEEFPDHPKVVTAGPLAGWLHVCALAYCNRHLTDGFVPHAQVPRLVNFAGVVEYDEDYGQVDLRDAPEVDPYRLAETLVSLNMWEKRQGGYLIHDFLEYQPSRAEIEAQRKVKREAGRAGGLRSGESRRSRTEAEPKQSAKQTGSRTEADQEPDGQAEGQAKSKPDPVPDPYVYKSSSSNSSVGDRLEEEEPSKIRTAVGIVAERRLQARTGDPITNASAWLRSVRAEVLRDHGSELQEMASEGMHPEAMADRIMPPPARHYAEAEEYRPTYGEDDVTVDEHGRLIVARRVG